MTTGESEEKPLRFLIKVVVLFFPFETGHRRCCISAIKGSVDGGCGRVFAQVSAAVEDAITTLRHKQEFQIYTPLWWENRVCVYLSLIAYNSFELICFGKYLIFFSSAFKAHPRHSTIINVWMSFFRPDIGVFGAYRATVLIGRILITHIIKHG